MRPLANAADFFGADRVSRKRCVRPQVANGDLLISAIAQQSGTVQVFGRFEQGRGQLAKLFRHLRSPVIGRASSRERVCQYVWISVVAVSLKKKQTYVQVK